MGQPDFYPFVMSGAVLRKVHSIHLLVRDQTDYAGLRTPPR